MSNRRQWRCRAMGVLLLALVGGCSDEYEHEQLGPDAERWQQTVAMLNELRSTGPDELDSYLSHHGARDLPEGRRDGLAAALRQLAEAEQIELIRMDAFGPDIYRATFRLTTGNTNSTTSMLLVETDTGLRWAGMN